MKIFPGKPLLARTVSCLTLIAAALTGTASPANAQDGNRWYQIEITIFAHESSDVLQEQWSLHDQALTYPEDTRRLDSLLDHLTLEDWSVLQAPVAADIAGNTESAETTETTETTESDSAVGPAALRSSDYRLPDALRDAFVALPASEHDFSQTNRALAQSAAYRVLYHNAWRQPVMRAAGATPVSITGGRRFDQHHELEGTLTIRFNQSRDRVLLDTNLWLARFSTRPPEQRESLQLPAYPAHLRSPAQRVSDMTAAVPAGAVSAGRDEQEIRYYVTDVYPMHDSLAMRSNEFHYLDHPALGILVQVFPYEPPAASAMQQSVSPFPGTDLPL
ncbi:MAG: CsiV family protein [Pseudohongiella sp.]